MSMTSETVQDLLTEIGDRMVFESGTWFDSGQGAPSSTLVDWSPQHLADYAFYECSLGEAKQPCAACKKKAPPLPRRLEQWSSTGTTTYSVALFICVAGHLTAWDSCGRRLSLDEYVAWRQRIRSSQWPGSLK